MAGPVWVFHRGALGDSVLLWPRLRLLKARGHAVTLVTDRSKGKLAAEELGIAAIGAESPRFHALWREGAAVERVEGVELVVDYVSPDRGANGEHTDLAEAPPSRWHGSGPWHENLARMFPGARIESGPAPTGADGRRLAAECPESLPRVRVNESGPVVMHVGAGSEAKRWAMENWVELAASVRAAGDRAELIAGEVEAERLKREDRAAFERAGGRFLNTLDDLAGVVRAARVFVGCDSGPTHLAAQMGVSTVALFGPTDPGTWGPVGARVRLIAPAARARMAWVVVAGVAAVVAQERSGRP